MMRTLRVTFLLALLSAPQTIHAAGFKIPDQGAKAGGMGRAFAAQADDPTTIALNLAGIDQLGGTQAALTSALLYVPGREFKSSIATLASDEADNQLADIPSFFLTSDLGSKRFHIGLGVYSLFDARMDWNFDGVSAPGAPLPQEGFQRYARRTDFESVFVNPVLSFAILPNRLSVAAGFIYGHASLHFDAKPVVDFGIGGARKVFDLDEDVSADSFSFNVGVQARLGDQVRAGAYYRNKMGLKMDGRVRARHLDPTPFGPAAADFATDLDVNVFLPGTVGFGVAFAVTPVLTIEVDGEYDTWKAFDEVSEKMGRPLLDNTGAPVLTSFDLSGSEEWRNTWSAHVGLQYQVTPSLALRGGYFFEENPVTGRNLTPIVPDGDRHGLTVGSGHTWAGWSLDVAYNAEFISDRSVDNFALLPQHAQQRGTYSSDPIHTLMLTLGLKF